MKFPVSDFLILAHKRSSNQCQNCCDEYIGHDIAEVVHEKSEKYHSQGNNDVFNPLIHTTDD